MIFWPAKGWPMFLGAAFGHPKDPRAASGRLKILYDYILNNSKILLDTIWISYSNCDDLGIPIGIEIHCNCITTTSNSDPGIDVILTDSHNNVVEVSLL